MCIMGVITVKTVEGFGVFTNQTKLTVIPIEVFINNTNLTFLSFLYKISIRVF